MHTTQSRLFHLAYAAILAQTIAISLVGGEALSDDTDLFFETGLASGATPNVLLILDNSSSMRFRIQPGGVTRADALVSVTEDIINSFSGLDIGLMTFNGSGARVLEPIRSLDAPGLGRNAVSVRVDRSLDDAAVSGGVGSQGRFVDFSFSPANTPLAPVYVNQGTGDEPFIPSIAASADDTSLTTVTLSGSVLSAYLGDTSVEARYGQIIDPDTLEVADEPGRHYAPLGSHYNGFSVEATLNFIRFDIASLGSSVINRMRGGCMVQAYMEFSASSLLADPARETSFLIHATPLGPSSAVDDDPPDPMPRNGKVYDEFLNKIDIGEVGHPDNSAMPVRWDVVDDGAIILTPNLSHIIQSSLGHPAFGDSLDNDYIYFSIDPRTVYDGDVSNDLSVYGLPDGFVDTPPPTREIYANSSSDPELNPRLHITYSDDACRTSVAFGSRQMLGAIFRDVRIPKGAPITDARLHLFPANDYLSEEDFRVNVYVARLGDADSHDWDTPASALATLSATDNVVWIDPGRDKRSLGSAATTRTSGVQWLAAQDITSPNLSLLLQEVVDDDSWCGGDSIIVYVEPRRLGDSYSDQSADAAAPAISSQSAGEEQMRLFHTFDSLPQLAPRLSAVFGEPIDSSDACNVYETRYLPRHSDMVFQNINSNCGVPRPPPTRINVEARNEFRTRDRRVHFLSFRDIGIPAGATIVNSKLLMSARRNFNVANTVFPRFLNFQVLVPQSSDEAIGYQQPTHGQRKAGLCIADYLLNERSTPAAVWDLGTGSWTVRDDPVYGNATPVLRETVDLTAQVQQAIDGPLWDTHDDIVFMLHSSDDIKDGENRRAFSVIGISGDSVRARPSMPALSLQWRSKSVPSLGARTHRGRLIDSLKALYFDNPVTPYDAVLREAHDYFANEEVYFGRRRSPDSNPDRADREALTWRLLTQRVSNVHSHNGSVIRPAGCTSFLSSLACIGSRLTAGASYSTADAHQECEPNYIIFVTDGQPSPVTGGFLTVFSQWMEGAAPDLKCGEGVVCPSDYTDLEEVSTKLFARAAAYLSSDSYSAPENPHNQQPIGIHTVGINVFDSTNRNARVTLETIAENGKGRFYPVDDVDQLHATFYSILSSFGEGAVSLSAPSLTIDSFNSLFSLDETFVSMFDPSYQDTLWTGNIKKYRLRGSCDNLAADPNCIVGQLVDANDEPVLDEFRVVNPASRSLWSSGADGDNVGAGGAAEIFAGQAFYPRLLFTDNGKSTPSGADLASAAYAISASNAARLSPYLIPSSRYSSEDLINWWRGLDAGDSDADGNTSESRWLVHDNLHTGVRPIIFGYDTSNQRPILKLLATTNAGEIRLINGHDGREEWRYVPQTQLNKAVAHLERLSSVITDNPNSRRIYGIDGPMSVMTFDCNLNGRIDSKPESSNCGFLSEEVDEDRVLAFTTERRGGNSVHAIELVPSQDIDNSESITDISPKFLWTIDAGSPGYSHLGQTWSQAVPMRIYAQEGNAAEKSSRLVVAFAAGYDVRNDLAADEDAPAAADRSDVSDLRGAAIYMADMFTGECVLHIGPSRQSACEYSTVVTGLTHSVAMTPGFLDSQMQGSTPERLGVDRFYFADLGGQVFRADLNVANVELPGSYAVVKKFADLGSVADSSGLPINRRQFYTTPLATPVRRDTVYSTTPNYDLIVLGSGTRPFPRSEGVQDRAYVLRDELATIVYDTTTVVPSLGEGGLFDASEEMPDADDVRGSDGYYLNFGEASALAGEKVLSQGAVLAGTWFLTTYSPESIAVDNECATGSGIGRFYAIDLLSGQPALDANNDGSVTVEDYGSIAGSGLISDIVPAFLEGGAVLLVNADGLTRPLDTGGLLNNLDRPIIHARRKW